MTLTWFGCHQVTCIIALRSAAGIVALLSVTRCKTWYVANVQGRYDYDNCIGHTRLILSLVLNKAACCSLGGRINTLHFGNLVS